MTIGDRIRQARIENGMTQKDLAEKLGVSYQNISQYERGVKQPKMETIEKIANALGTDASYIRNGESGADALSQQILELFQRLDEDSRGAAFDFFTESLPEYVAKLRSAKKDELIAELAKIASNLSDNDIFLLLGMAKGLAFSAKKTDSESTQ